MLWYWRSCDVALAMVVVWLMPRFGNVAAREDGAKAAEEYQRARRLFATRCPRCHSSTSKQANKDVLEHFYRPKTDPFGGLPAGGIGAHVRRMMGEPALVPDKEPRTLVGEDLAVLLSWADVCEASQKAKGHEPDSRDHREHENDTPEHSGPGANASADASADAGASAFADGLQHEPEPGVDAGPAGRQDVPFAFPRESLIPGRPGPPGVFRVMINAFTYVQNLGLAGYRIENDGVRSYSAGLTLPLLSGDWAIGYYRGVGGSIEALLMIDLEPLHVDDAGTPELGQSGEQLWDSQHPHQLLHQAMLAFHPLAGSGDGYDLSLFAGQGTATIGPPPFWHRASAPGPTVPRKHQKGENAHETFPVFGAAFRLADTALEASVFNAIELTPDDGRLYPKADTPDSFALRVRQNFEGNFLGLSQAELQVSAERLVDLEPAPDQWQLSTSFYGSKATRWRVLRDWRVDFLVDSALELPSQEGHGNLYGSLFEIAARSPDRHDVLWFRNEMNQREEPPIAGRESEITLWEFHTLGFERVLIDHERSGLHLAAFGEVTWIDIPDALAGQYGRSNATTIAAGLHLFGIWTQR